MRSAGRIAYRAYTFLVLAPLAAASMVAVGAAAILLSVVLSPRVVGRLCGRSWARLCAFLTPMRVSVEGADNLDPRGSYVIVSNHQSEYDVVVVYGWLDTDFRWVIRRSMRMLPLVASACSRMGHVVIDHTDHDSAVTSLRAARERVTDGTSIMFFAEGDLSPDGRLGTLKRGAFRMALDFELPILPITVVGTRAILAPGSTEVRPGHARLVIHPPIAAQEYAHGRVGELIERVGQVIASALPEVRVETADVVDNVVSTADR